MLNSTSEASSFPGASNSTVLWFPHHKVFGSKYSSISTLHIISGRICFNRTLVSSSQSFREQMLIHISITIHFWEHMLQPYVRRITWYFREQMLNQAISSLQLIFGSTCFNRTSVVPLNNFQGQILTHINII